MVIELISRKKLNVSYKATIYNKVFTAVDSVVTAAFLFPPNELYDIGVSWDSVLDPVIEFTFGTESDIIDDSALWMAWDRVSIINTAATAMRVDNTTGGNIDMVLTLRTGID